MMIKFTSQISCPDERCADAILNMAEKRLGVKLMGRTKNDDLEGHVSVSHESGSHKIWIFVYDNDGKHESETIEEEPLIQGKTYESTRTLNNIEIGTFRKIIIQDNQRCKKPTVKPNRTQQDNIKALNQTDLDAEVKKIPLPTDTVN